MTNPVWHATESKQVLAAHEVTAAGLNAAEASRRLALLASSLLPGLLIFVLP